MHWLSPSPYKLLSSKGEENDELLAHERVTLKVRSFADGYIAAFLCNGSESVRLIYPHHVDDDTRIENDEVKEIQFRAPEKPGRYRINFVWTKYELLDPRDIDFSDLEFDPALQGFSKWFYWDELEKDEWGVATFTFTMSPETGSELSTAVEPSRQIFALRPFGLEGTEPRYWAPLVFDELRKGRARFSWSSFDGADLWTLRKNPDGLTPEERDCWKHSKFLLDVNPGDLFLYVNVPSYGECAVVERVQGMYDFTPVWDPEGRGDLRHALPCRYIGTFDRNSPAVHPELSKRLKLRLSHWKLEGLESLVIDLMSRLCS